ncbi:hypothetical protein Y1Q_0008177 [Alligator mississippiensis]|uniref:Uncharacterized protein n=1 Tax=Alligator mississippiensis TaxID=8496 RepID=A0A151N199_ALLMI|nr:hypothetical protein Y1Q_0008177 [Alligator mississippiensis]
MRDEIISAVMECLDRRWGQWVNQYIEETFLLQEVLEKLASRYDPGVSTVPRRGQQMEVDKGDVIAVQEVNLSGHRACFLPLNALCPDCLPSTVPVPLRRNGCSSALSISSWRLPRPLCTSFL